MIDFSAKRLNSKKSKPFWKEKEENNHRFNLIGVCGSSIRPMSSLSTLGKKANSLLIYSQLWSNNLFKTIGNRKKKKEQDDDGKRLSRAKIFRNHLMMLSVRRDTRTDLTFSPQTFFFI